MLLVTRRYMSSDSHRNPPCPQTTFTSSIKQPKKLSASYWNGKSIIQVKAEERSLSRIILLPYQHSQAPYRSFSG